MKRIALLTIVVVAVPAIWADDPGTILARFEPAQGKWVNNERSRESLDSPWKSGESEWTVRIMPGGLVMETPGHIKIGDGPTVHWVQVWGFDPRTTKPYVHVFVSDGAQISGSFNWNGNVVEMPVAVTLPDGNRQDERCEWKFRADFETATVKCQRRSGNDWWTFREADGKKAK